MFDLDAPVRPYDMHLESLSAAAAALDDAHSAVQAATDALNTAHTTTK
ncbi:MULTISPECIES: hypothetical protein [unclassified Mycolicibacterium]|nr:MULTISPECIES: hypothetical protein [unclassified Mycolicibacterium]